MENIETRVVRLETAATPDALGVWYAEHAATTGAVATPSKETSGAPILGGSGRLLASYLGRLLASYFGHWARTRSNGVPPCCETVAVVGDSSGKEDTDGATASQPQLARPGDEAGGHVAHEECENSSAEIEGDGCTRACAHAGLDEDARATEFPPPGPEPEPDPAAETKLDLRASDSDTPRLAGPSTQPQQQQPGMLLTENPPTRPEELRCDEEARPESCLAAPTGEALEIASPTLRDMYACEAVITAITSGAEITSWAALSATCASAPAVCRLEEKVERSTWADASSDPENGKPSEVLPTPVLQQAPAAPRLFANVAELVDAYVEATISHGTRAGVGQPSQHQRDEIHVFTRELIDYFIRQTGHDLYISRVVHDPKHWDSTVDVLHRMRHAKGLDLEEKADVRDTRIANGRKKKKAKGDKPTGRPPRSFVAGLR